MAWSGISYDQDEEEKQVTINIDFGDKISSYTISNEDYRRNKILNLNWRNRKPAFVSEINV